MKNLKVLHKLLENIWHDGNGRYASIGDWEIGLGGYDTGYEVSYRGSPVFRITKGNEFEPYWDEKELKRQFSLSYRQIFNTLKEYKDLKHLELFEGVRL